MMTSGMHIDQILDRFGLTGDQRQASAERRRDVTVTAGAGSGKTRTLVARYVGLLSEGYAPRQVAAITFTEKAAREMRTRVRLELRRLALGAESPEARLLWSEIEAQMDSARIGTIHSLCAEILRAHPAEAGLDPQFGVAEESETVRLRSAAVESALMWAAEQPGDVPGRKMRALFEQFSVGRLSGLIGLLLNKRLEVTPGALDSTEGQGLVAARLERFLRDERVRAVLADFRAAHSAGSLAADAGDKLADQILRLLASLEQAEQALARGAPLACARALWQGRSAEMALNVGKRSSVNKEALRALRGLYDVQLGPWLGGKEPPDEQAEALLVELMPLLGAVYARALAGYRAALDERQTLDFDDLEAGALALLEQPAVARRWQAEIAAVLVDEFQDTNARQRQLVQRLCGEQPGRLFVVGDARQSIYRFRGADVTVFTSLQAAVRARGGLTLNLDRTFRAHAGLLDATGSLLAAAMGDQPDPERPFFVPFAPLSPQRDNPRDGGSAPFVECVLGAGEDSETGRQAAARALAQRLRQLRGAGEIQSWAEVTLLFRASSGFPYYEEAFESAGIPFVTVAGSGFYDRPEVREVLNLLRALSDPWDDQALAGFLRSPAVGLSDPALYRLRYQEGAYLPLRQSLEAHAAHLPEGEQPAAERALAILRDFEPLVDRLPVAELLRQLLARMDTLAVLAVSRSRLWRNVDKLLGDAQRSGLVRVRAFLEYIDALRDVGAREGEAIAAAEGAVRLMTIHKSKGLEFPVVVLADAARQPVGGGSLAYALPLPDQRASGAAAAASCWAVAPDRAQAAPLLFRLAKHLDSQQSEAENGRLLYVAMTRAQERLLISGHLTLKADGSWRSNGWLQALFEAGGADVDGCLAAPGSVIHAPLAGGGSWRLWLGGQAAEAQAAAAAEAGQWPDSAAAPLVAGLAGPRPAPTTKAEEEAQEWSLLPAQPPAVVIGSLVHHALRRWRFAEGRDPALDRLLRQRARLEGVEEGDALDEVLRVANLLLARFRRHPLWSEIQSAAERYHAVPSQGKDGTSYVDVLYRTPSGWKLLDFHTGSLRGAAAVPAAADLRRPALLEKQRAVKARVGETPKAGICFLDADHQVVVVWVEE